MKLKHILSALVVVFSTVNLLAQQNNPGIIKGKIIEKTFNLKPYYTSKIGPVFIFPKKNFITKKRHDYNSCLLKNNSIK